MKKLKKPLIITGIVLGSLLLVSVAVGIISGLTGVDLRFGWMDYRYDDSDYTVGSGTVYADHISTIDISWIDGRVEVIACRDSYISITESVDGQLGEDALVHWRVSEDGNTLSVKYRASSWYWGVTEDHNKSLILRVPERFFDSLIKVAVESASAEISIKGIQSDAINLASRSGRIVTENCMAQTSDLKTTSGNIVYAGEISKMIKAETVGGNIALVLPKDSSFTVQYSGQTAKEPRIAFPHKKEGDTYLCGNGERNFHVDVSTKNGEVKIEY